MHDPFFTRDIASVSTTSKEIPYDVLIVGGGPAGLQCAVYALSEGLSVCLVESNKIGGQIRQSPMLTNVIPMGSGISGIQFASECMVQLQSIARSCSKKFTAVNGTVGDFKKLSDMKFEVAVHAYERTDINKIFAKTVVLATGMRWSIDSDSAITSVDIDDIVLQEDWIHTHNPEDVALIIGGGNSACQAALYLNDITIHPVNVVVRSEISASDYIKNALGKCASDRIRIFEGYQVHRVIKTLSTYTATLKASSDLPDQNVVFNKVYYMGNSVPNSRTLVHSFPSLLNGDGFIKTRGVATEIPGIFACGDVRAGQTRRLAIAMGSGAAAVTAIHEYLKSGKHPKSTSA